MTAEQFLVPGSGTDSPRWLLGVRYCSLLGLMPAAFCLDLEAPGCIDLDLSSIRSFVFWPFRISRGHPFAAVIITRTGRYRVLPPRATQH